MEHRGRSASITPVAAPARLLRARGGHTQARSRREAMENRLSAGTGAVGARPRINTEVEAARRVLRDPRTDAELSLDEAAARLLEEIAPNFVLDRAGPGVAEGTTPVAARPD